MKSYKNTNYCLGVSINKTDGLKNNSAFGAYAVYKKVSSFNIASLWQGGWSDYPTTWSAQGYKS